MPPAQVSAPAWLVYEVVSLLLGEESAPAVGCDRVVLLVPLAAAAGGLAVLAFDELALMLPLSAPTCRCDQLLLM